MSKLSDYLKKNGLKVLGNAVKVGVGFAGGGPVGAIAAAAQALGLPDDSDDAAVLAAAQADPMALVKLREAENAIPLARIEADTKELEAELFTKREIKARNTEDRNSARDMQKETKSKTPIVLAYFTLVAFGLAFISLFFFPILPSNENLMYVFAGALMGNMTQVFNFFFGSSEGSKSKTTLIDKMTKDDAAEDLEMMKGRGGMHTPMPGPMMTFEGPDGDDGYVTPSSAEADKISENF